jgi:CzcA family heavy metal efflux pump
MLRGVVLWSLRYRVVVVALAVLMLGAGVFAVHKSRLDVFPEFAPPTVIIQTEAPGLSPSEVEQLVTLPVEYTVNGIPRLDVLRSQSIPGLSVVTIIFQDGTDIYRARQQVAERLGELAGQLPPGVRAPRMAPLTSTTGRLLTVGFTGRPLGAADYLGVLAPSAAGGVGGLPWPGLFLAGRKYSPVPDAMKLRDLAQWLVRPRLLAQPGVAQVMIFGGDVRQFQVHVDPAKLASRNLTFGDVMDATRQATGIRAAGFMENAGQRLTMRVEAQVRSPAELGAAVIQAPSGTPVLLRDVASVVEGPEPKFGDALLNGGGPAVALIVNKQIDADTQEVTERVEKELERLEPLLKAEGVTYHRALARQATFIDHSIRNVTHSLLIGAALVAVVLFVFLNDLRTAFISLTAIPLSLLSAITVLWALGISLNTLTIGGLAIAVGEVVDDAIIDVENIHRRLWLNTLLARPRSALEVVLDASLEVRGSVVYATLIVVLVFVPVFLMSGLLGRLFSPLGYAYVLAVLASLLTALTVTPALALVLLPSSAARGLAHTPGTPQGAPYLLRKIQSGYEWLLHRLDRGAPAVVTAAAALVLAAVAALWLSGRSFLPKLRESHFVVTMRGMPGMSLQQSLTAGERVAAALSQEKAVRSVLQQAGRAELGEDTTGVEYSELEVALTELAAEDIERVERSLNRRLSETPSGKLGKGEDIESVGGIPGFGFDVAPYLTHRINETLSGSATGAVVIKVYADDLETMDMLAENVRAAVARAPGVMAVRFEPQTGAPELVVRLRQKDASRLGVKAGHVLDAVHAAFQGAEVGQVYDRNRVIDMVVILDPKLRQIPGQVAELWLPAGAPAGEAPAVEGVPPAPAPRGRVQLGQVADVYLSDGRFLIAHEGGLRRQQVSFRIRDGFDVASVAAAAEAEVNKLKLPPGASLVFGGEEQARRTAVREIVWLSAAILAVVVLLLWLAFGSVRLLALVLVNVPFALVGGVAAIYLAGRVMDVGSLIGFVTLFGITMRNGIMMVSHWQHLHEVERMAWGPELVMRGAKERLAPVLMTALVTGLGLLPIAIGSGEAGREIEGPMALVILGGLVTSTALNLFVLPLLYRRLASPTARTA